MRMFSDHTPSLQVKWAAEAGLLQVCSERSMLSATCAAIRRQTTKAGNNTTEILSVRGRLHAHQQVEEYWAEHQTWQAWLSSQHIATVPLLLSKQSLAM